MLESIQKLKDLVAGSTKLSQEEKNDLQKKLNVFADISNQRLIEYFELLAQKAAVDETEIKKFFEQFDKMIDVFIDQGPDSLIDQAKKDLNLS